MFGRYQGASGMIRKLAAVLMFCAFTASAQQTVSACRCAPPAVRTAYKRADTVITAKVLSIDADSGGRQRVSLSVSQAWKRTVPDDLTINNSRVCPFSFEEGKDYLLFVSKDQNGALYVDRCTRNRPVEQADESLRWLQQNASKIEVASKTSARGSRMSAHRRAARLP